MLLNKFNTSASNPLFDRKKVQPGCVKKKGRMQPKKPWVHLYSVKRFTNPPQEAPI